MFRAVFAILSLCLCTVFAQNTPNVAAPSPTGAASESKAPTASDSETSQDSKSLSLVKNFPVAYPTAAQTANTMGQVLLKISVSEDGAVRTADVLKGDPVLAVAAVDAVKHWEFAPFVRNGKAVKASTTVPLWFAIADGKCTHDVRQATVTTPFDNVVTVSESDMKPFVCKKTPAALTGLAQLARVSGDVVLHVNIGKDGMVTNILVVRSASPMLTGSAIDAVRQWRYRPYLVSNEPTVVDTEITVSF